MMAKMKTYIHLLYIGLLSLAMSSCNSFLDNDPISDFTGDPQTSSSEKSAYSTTADAEAGLSGAYEKFKQDIFQFENYEINDVQSDNCYVGGDGVPGEDIDNLAVNSLNEKVTLIWNQYYEMAGTATNVIENTRIMDQSSIEEATRQRIMAEAKFIRAYAYFDIVRIWGDAPMILDLIPSITAANLDSIYSKLYPVRTSATEIYKQIKKDLTEAIPVLGSSSQGAFKATKGAANGLLAKVYATEGEKKSRSYDKVVSCCDEVIADGYQLLDTYDDLWKPENKNTNESIFEVYYDMEHTNWASWVLFSEEDGSVTWRRYCTPTHDLISKFEDKDVRYASTIVYKDVPYDTYFPADHYPIANKIRQKNSDIILMRLADILLLKAEALVELNRVSEAMEIVNKIRERAQVDPVAVSQTQDEGRLIVENERQLELALEGQRWFDLLRNDRMIAVMGQHKDKNGHIMFPNIKNEAFRVLWPIPQNERDANTNLTQNKGY
jgi:hypothetical protein